MSTSRGARTTVAISRPFSESATHFSPRWSTKVFVVYCKILPVGLKRIPTISIFMLTLPYFLHATAGILLACRCYGSQGYGSQGYGISRFLYQKLVSLWGYIKICCRIRSRCLCHFNVHVTPLIDTLTLV